MIRRRWLGVAAILLATIALAVFYSSRALAEKPEKAAESASEIDDSTVESPVFAPAMPFMAKPPGDQETPGQAAQRCSWPRGEPKAEREAFEVLQREGNALSRESLYPLAADKLREGLSRCDHPGGHFNLALALLNLDRPLEVREQFELATKFGPEPLKGKERFENAKNYLKLLESQLVKVKVRCDVPGAKVTMDGEELFTPPGEAERWTRAGRHYLVATKEGYVANEVSRTFDPGVRPVYDLKLNTQEELTEYRRRWSQAVPWSFIGAGVAVGLAGGGLFYAGIQARNEAQSQAREKCSTGGCATSLPDVAGKGTRSARLRQVAVGTFIVGGASVVTGAILQYLNRPRSFRRSYDVDAETSQVSLAPILDGNVRGVQAMVAF